MRIKHTALIRMLIEANQIELESKPVAPDVQDLATAFDSTAFSLESLHSSINLALGSLDSGLTSPLPLTSPRLQTKTQKARVRIKPKL